MIKRFTIYIAAILAITGMMMSCNDNSNKDIEFTYSSTMVKSFKLQRDDSVLNRMDTIYFSIDLVNGRIFNADSLPFGTKTDALLVSLKTDNCSKIEFHCKGRDGKDKVVDYMTSSTDSINFADGPVKLHLVSFDGKAERDYMVQVNVHTMVPDSLYWDRLARRNLPSTLTGIISQHTTRSGDKAVCLTASMSDYCIALNSAPASDPWTYIEPDISFNPDISTLTGTDDALYMLDRDGHLYRSTDDGRTWNVTDQTWTYIYGAYGQRLLGVTEGNDGQLHHVAYDYPAAVVSDASVGDCPVSGTTQPAKFDSKWSVAPQLTILGGRTADGSLTSATWGYDGNSWAKLSDNFPMPIEGAVLVSYEITTTDSLSWTSTRTPALLAMGGRTNQLLNNAVYISRDFGMNWHKGDINLQLPSYLTVGYDAQALVFDSTITAKSENRNNKAVRPVTEWQAPYIYLFGGRDLTGTLLPWLWRGVINSLTFKPLQ